MNPRPFIPDPVKRIARCPEYLAWIREQPCACCGKTTRVVAAHTSGPKGVRIKSSDFTCIPLHWWCHVEQETIGHVSFAEKRGLDYRDIRLKMMERFIMERLA